MPLSTKKNSFNKIILLVAGIAFGLVALAMGYQGVKTYTDTRSRAAQEGIEYKRWDFAGSTEGWTGTSVSSIQAENGSLSATVGPGSIIKSSSEKIDIPAGNKYITMRLGAVSQGGTMVLGDQIDQSSVRTLPSGCTWIDANTAQCGDSIVHYGNQSAEEIQNYWTPERMRDAQPAPMGRIQGESGANKGGTSVTRSISVSVSIIGIPTNNSVDIKVPVDGSVNNYSLLIPHIDALTVNEIDIKIGSGVVQGDRMLLDFVRLMGQNVQRYDGSDTGSKTACTQEAKICPNGTSVGRTGSNCEFAPCPDTNQNPIPTSTRAPPVVRTPTPTPITTDRCTLEAKVCPDGSTVGRTGSNCEFAPCPSNPDVASCLYDGQSYKSGEGFPSTDRCNTCSCYDGRVRCTTRACTDDSSSDDSDSIITGSVTWEECTSTAGSVTLQLNPRVCKTTDGRTVTEQSVQSENVIVRSINSVVSFFRNLFQ